MTTIKLRHQGPLVGPVPTFDTIDSERHADMAAAEIELALGNRRDAQRRCRFRSSGGRKSASAGRAHPGDREKLQNLLGCEYRRTQRIDPAVDSRGQPQIETCRGGPVKRYTTPRSSLGCGT
jgi:hypothetical protein